MVALHIANFTHEFSSPLWVHAAVTCVSCSPLKVTLPSANIQQPEWNHSFLFTSAQQPTPLFTPGSALVIELYQAATGQSNVKLPGWYRSAKSIRLQQRGQSNIAYWTMFMMLNSMSNVCFDMSYFKRNICLFTYFLFGFITMSKNSFLEVLANVTALWYSGHIFFPFPKQNSAVSLYTFRTVCYFY